MYKPVYKVVITENGKRVASVNFSTKSGAIDAYERAKERGDIAQIIDLSENANVHPLFQSILRGVTQ